MLTWRKRIGLMVSLVLVVIAITVGVLILAFLERDVPETHTDVIEHFKYGSIGSELMPYWVWLVLPDLFPEYLPDRPGEGYARMGMIYESDTAKRPIGTSYRERPVPLVGLNCAVCQTGTVRDSSEAEPRIILGMPAHNFDLLSYTRFFFAAARDKRFNADTILPAIEEENPEFSWFDRLLYRLFVIPQFRNALVEIESQFAWTDLRPDPGPGRTDTFNPFNKFYGFHPESDRTVGTADLPSLWNQRVREPMQLHWDGNNTSVDERNRNAAIGAGAIQGMEDKIDLDGINRVGEWTRDLPAPELPQARIDRSRIEAGAFVFNNHCARCHALDGDRVGRVTPLWEVGTDPERLRSFTNQLEEKLNKIGSGRPWAYSHFRKTDGYANMPLDGIWLRAPYLHNGSVPTLRDSIFYRGYEVYDFDSVGFVSSGPEAERFGVKYDTRERGNSNLGHLYGTDLTEKEKRDLLEFLKTQ